MNQIDRQRAERPIGGAGAFKFDLAGAMARLAPETVESHQPGRSAVCERASATTPVDIHALRPSINLRSTVVALTELAPSAEVAEVDPVGPYLPVAVVPVVRPTQVAASSTAVFKPRDHRGRNRRNTSRHQPVVRPMFSVSLVASLLVGAIAFGHSYIYSADPTATAISAGDNTNREAPVSP